MKQQILFAIICFGLSFSIPEARASSQTDNKGFLIDSNCNDAFDCYINQESGLALACYYNVNKCSCMNTFMSIYNLESIGNQCLMSKYGPCGTGNSGKIEVGCSDGFSCIDGRCRDPQDAARRVKDVFEFNTGNTNCRHCAFSSDLTLECRGWGAKPSRCLCQEQEIADARGKLFSLRNYDGDKNCSMSQFGPCGERNGVKIDCHGEGIQCVDGTCINPQKPKSELHGPCEYNKNCGEGLICNRNTYKCITAKSVSSGGTCSEDEECVEGLRCIHNPAYGPWNDPECRDPKSPFPNRPEESE